MADPTTEELIQRTARADAAAREAAAHVAHITRTRGEGLRLKLSAIEGLTKGDAARVLRTPYLFQCPPLEEFRRNRPRQIGRWTNYKGDEHVTRGGRGLMPLSFRTIVAEIGSFVVEYNYDVQKLVESLERLRDDGYPFHLLATHRYQDKAEISMPVLMVDCVVIENAGEPDARYLDLEFVEYRPQKVARTTKTKPHGRKRPGGKHWPQYITFDKNGRITKKPSSWKFTGELTLSKIADVAYRKPSTGQYIARSQKPPIKDFGSHTPLIRYHRFKGKGGKILVPQPPDMASINQPD